VHNVVQRRCLLKIWQLAPLKRWIRLPGYCGMIIIPFSPLILLCSPFSYSHSAASYSRASVAPNSMSGGNLDSDKLPSWSLSLWGKALAINVADILDFVNLVWKNTRLAFRRVALTSVGREGKWIKMRMQSFVRCLRYMMLTR